MIIPAEEIAYRDDFALLLNARDLRGVAVEVGTDLGVFAKSFRSRWEGRLLYCIDPYDPYDGIEGSRETVRDTAVYAMMPWHGRVRFIEIPSPKAAAMIPSYDMPLDFVYIDGNHDYKSVLADMDAWWPLLRDTGIMAGHDFDSTHPEVMAAVQTFTEHRGLLARVTKGPNDPCSSWYIYRQEPRKLFKRYFDDREIDNPYGKGGR